MSNTYQEHYIYTDRCFLPEKDELRNESLRMVIQRLIRELFCVSSICVVAIGEDSGHWDLACQKITKPEYAVTGCVRAFAMAVQTMDGDDAEDGWVSSANI
jgi:hypothetical protein